ncbi:NDP-hexose 2,3-dehydratase family protein [Streptomyces sp. TLI_171]|uniref:NDP-hexose 2,3-dehydratase family protein n=1 Tax=Streptomyces sp. TLI_171 TaxID=1938859 RepID=UPI000C198A04|nr:NDP-hexose 2,3-dehydratase family protein [Streptomyces sp. TLI_171]RKE21295.1 oxidase EvaA [Streptomyces sp. TLI_171]
MSAPDSAPAAVRPREDAALAARIARSAAATEGARLSTAQFAEWLAGRGRANDFKVEKIPFAELVGWSFDPDTGNLVHRSGRFFSVEGLHVTVDDGPYREWHQPIIKQPEVGILGIVVKEFDGVLHCLMQAKMEPGNRNLLQLSPTVQATRSNYTKVHKGADVKYIEYFIGGRPRRVLADVLQSEHGSWFFHKSNRNMIVEALDEVPLHEDFCWLTFGQIAELLRRDNVVNMDSRTVLACAPHPDPDGRALHPDTELLSWFTGQRSRYDIRAERVPLAGLPGWKQGEHSIDHEQGRFFQVVAVSVTAGSREVTSWTQPLIEPVGPGVAAFLTRRIDGVRHVLAHAKVEGGFLDAVELAPTVQCTPGNHDRLPPFLDLVLDAAPERIRYRAVHSEEGGRFLHAEADYLIVEVGDLVPVEEPEGYAWVTPGQLATLVRHGHYVNVQARTLLAVLNGLPEDD